MFRSKLENAEKFQDWVMEVVLPSLRKDGGYVVQQVAAMRRKQLVVLRSILQPTKFYDRSRF